MVDITGAITHIGDEQQISDKFSKRDIVIETGDKYPNPLLVEFANGQMRLISGVQVGDQVTVTADIRGRRWEKPGGGEKYFVSLRGFKIDNPDERARFKAPTFEPDKKDDIPF